MHLSRESIFTQRYAAVVIILLAGTGTDLTLVWCNVPPQSSPNQGIKGALVPSSVTIPIIFQPVQPPQMTPKQSGQLFFRAAEFPNARHLLIDVNWNFYPPPSRYLVSRTFGLLGFDIDENAAFRISKKNKTKRIHLNHGWKEFAAFLLSWL